MKCVWLALFFAVSGCSQSALVAPTDPTFAHATSRLERTATEVETSGAPLDERVLFMQAEAMYRYRFAASGRGVAAVTAEAAAALTDFPVLQSFAGSLDLVPFRFQSSDVATQLWEGFLVAHPRSVLRPLTLYRLGWSYRSSGISGLPRASGDEAFAELRDGDTPPTLQIAASAARAVPWKSKEVAARWSLVPGLGQLYVGETSSGLARLGVALAAAAAVVAPAIVGLTRASDLTWKHDWPLLAIGVGGLVVLSFDYTSSYEDALRGVIHFNERAERDFERDHPDAP